MLITLLKETLKNIEMAEGEPHIFRDWHKCKTGNKIMDNLEYNNGIKNKKLTIEEKEELLNFAKKERFIEIIKIKNKNILKITMKGEEFLKKTSLSQMLEIDFGLK